jgi:hypothetical protein
MRLLKQAGFSIVDVSRHARAVESVVEAELQVGSRGCGEVGWHMTRCKSGRA